MSSIRTMSTGELVLRIEQTTSADHRGDMKESGARLSHDRDKAKVLGAEVKKLREDAERLAQAAKDVKQPHTFFGKLFNGRSKAREAEAKAQQAEAKSREAEETRLILSSAEREVKDSLGTLEATLDRRDRTLRDVVKLIDQTGQEVIS